MKKLCRKSTVHPSPATGSGDLSFLPAAILTLAAALSDDDRRVLAYLLSADPRRRPNRRHESDHAPLFACGCFGCYTSYWARWDSSPNRHLIHDVIDAVEASPAHKKARKKRPTKSRPDPETKPDDQKEDSPGDAQVAAVHGGDVVIDGSEKGSVRKMVSFIGEKIWGVWG